MIDLRDLVAEDAGRLFAWRREPDVNRWMSDSPPDTLEAQERWVEGVIVDPDRSGWIITAGGRPSGFLMLSGLTDCNRRAEWGWYIGDPDARGRGVGRAAQALGLDKAFDQFGLEKVTAEVLADNEAALKAQGSCGFRREGYLRSHALKDGVFRDVVLLAILAGEWRARRAQVRKALALSHLIAA
jgi:UDP-4-amino-4,6-dideoxy-N-acetyl-beta-L-altrosamine N-acetyltransferase